MNKILSVDLDEVLAETVDEVLKYNNYTIKGIPIHREDISDYYISNIPKYGLTKEEAVGYFSNLLENKARENIKPVQGAKEKLEQIKKNGWRIFVVTARRDKIADYTRKWIKQNYEGIIDDILFSNSYTDKEIPKSALCKKIGSKIMIEDNLDFALELVKSDIEVFLLDKPWNQHYDSKIHYGVHKIYSWSEINL